MIDYQAQKFDELLHDIDFVFDTVGGETMRRSLDVLKTGGTLVTTQWPELDTIKEAATQRGLHAAAVLVPPNQTQLEMLAAQVTKGIFRVNIDAVYPLQELPAALKRLRNGGVNGKIVVNMETTDE